MVCNLPVLSGAVYFSQFHFGAFKNFLSEFCFPDVGGKGGVKASDGEEVPQKAGEVLFVDFEQIFAIGHEGAVVEVDFFLVCDITNVFQQEEGFVRPAVLVVEEGKELVLRERRGVALLMPGMFDMGLVRNGV